jgi:uncharacterized repeat protein (TIGR01451 family)
MAVLSLAVCQLARGVDPDHLSIAVTSPQNVSLSFPVTVTALAADGAQVTNYNGPLTLTAVGSNGPVAVQGGQELSFTNGFWTGSIAIQTNGVALNLVAETSNGVHGAFSPLNVLPLSLQEVPLLVEDMVYDSTRDRIFASVGSSVPIYSNGVVRIHPASGAIEAAVSVGQITTPSLLTYYNDGKLALSDNGQYLYVAYSNAVFVRRIELATMTAGPSFAVGTDGLDRALSVADMEVLPGQALSVAIVQTRWDIYGGIAVYDNGMQRPNMAREQYQVLAPSTTASRLYALGYPGFSRLNVDASGITLQDGLAFPGAGTPIKLEFEGGLCFVASGAVIDPLVPVMLGKFVPPASSSLVAPDMARQRACFIGNVGTYYSIQPHSLNGFLALKPLYLPKSYDYVRCFIRGGPNTYAFSTSIGGLFLVQSPLLTPSGAPADVTVVQTSAPSFGTVGSNVTISVTVSNAGPAEATDVAITSLLDANVSFVSAVASQGASPFLNGLQVACNFGNLTAGSNATLTLTVRPMLGGWLTNSVTVLANEADTNMANNVSLHSFFARIPSGTETVAAIRLASRDLASATTTSRLYASVPSTGVVVSNAVVPIDPLTGQFDPAVLTVNDPGRLTVSDDSQFLYAGAGADQTIWRVDLPAGTATLSFAVGAHPDPLNPVPYGVDDMEVLPGQPHALAISRRRAATATWASANVGIAIYDDGVTRSLTSAGVPETDTIEFGTTASDLYGYNRPVALSIGSRSFRRLGVNSSGVTLRDSDSTLITGQAEDIRCEAGLLFTTGGSLIDPQTRSKLGSVGTLQTSSLVEPDPASGRVFYLIPTSTASQWVLRAFDLHTLAPLGSLTITNIVGTPGRLVRWGNDGLAFRTSGDLLFLLRTSLIPAAPPADLAIACEWTPSPATVGSNMVFTLTATNRGPLTASNVVASLLLPVTFTNISVTSTQAACGTSNMTAFCRAATLASGSAMTFTVQTRPTKVGLFRVFAGLLSSNTDPQAADNTLEVAVAVNTAGKINQPDELPLQTRDMVFDRVSGNLLASVNAGAQAFPGSIISIDPATGQAAPVQHLEIDPARLAVADDGSLLYVGAADSNSVVRLDLQALVGSPWVALGTNTGQRVTLQDMEVLPGIRNSIALSWVAGSKRSIVIYDDGIARTNCPVDSLGGRFLAFGGTADTLYANGNGGRLRMLGIVTNGLSEQWGVASLLGASEDLEFDSGLLYTSAGKVINPVTRLLEVTLTGLSSDALVKTLVSAGRVFYLTKSGANWSLQAYDSRTLGLIGSLTVSNVLGTPSRLLQWNTNGFAFRTSSNQVFLVRTDLLPSSPPADLAVTGAAQPATALVGSNLTFTMTVTNLGPNTASNVVFTDRLSADMNYVSAASARGSCTQSNKVVRCQIDRLAAGEHATVTITVIPQFGGGILNLASVVSSAADPDTANNASSLVIPTLLRLPPNAIGSLRLDAAGLVYDAAAGRLYASVSNALSAWRNSIVAIDPRNGDIQKLFSVNLPSRLALSDDSEFLYVATDGDVGVTRFHLPSRTTNLTFYVRDPAAPLDIYIRDLAVVPNAHSRLAVAVGPRNTSASGHWVSLYDDAIPGTNSGHGSEIEFVSGSVLFGYEHNIVPDQTYRMNVQSNGLFVTDTVGYLVAGHMKFDSGFLYTASGQIIDPVAMSVVGTFPIGGSFIEPRIAEQRVYFLTLTNANSAWGFYACDTTTRQLAGGFIVTNLLGVPDDLLRCGYDMLAFRTATNQVCLLRTSLVPPAPGADSDGDGQPDSWEVAHGLDILSAADAWMDADGDGMSNLNEFLAGTNPTNAASVFRLTQTLGGSGLEIGFQSTTGKLYRIERKSELSAGAWEVVTNGIPGNGSNISLVLPINPARNNFYRALVLP